MTILLFFVVHWYLSLFAQTFFLHRYSAHRMFTMSPFWEKVFHVFTWMAQGSSYLNPAVYGMMHRAHHVYADTEQDPHSPKYDENPFNMMRKTAGWYNALLHGTKEPEERFTRDLPHWKTMERIGESWVSRIAWGLLYVAFYVAFATAWWQWLLLPLQFVMGPLHGVIINWYAHRYGYVSYPTDNSSKNLMPLDVFMMGEGLHNNHHTHASRANFSTKWWEFDPTWPIIRALDAVGVIRLRKAAA